MLRVGVWCAVNAARIIGPLFFFSEAVNAENTLDKLSLSFCKS
jgi:hypothetical protein